MTCPPGSIKAGLMTVSADLGAPSDSLRRAEAAGKQDIWAVLLVATRDPDTDKELKK